MKTSELRRDLQCAEITMRCIQIGMVIVTQGIALIVFTGHYSLELRAWWERMKARFEDWKRQMIPERVKTTGKLWDDVEEALRLGGLA